MLLLGFIPSVFSGTFPINTLFFLHVMEVRILIGMMVQHREKKTVPFLKKLLAILSISGAWRGEGLFLEGGYWGERRNIKQ